MLSIRKELHFFSPQKNEQKDGKKKPTDENTKSRVEVFNWFSRYEADENNDVESKTE